MFKLAMDAMRWLSASLFIKICLKLGEKLKFSGAVTIFMMEVFNKSWRLNVTDSVNFDKNEFICCEDANFDTFWISLEA